MLAETKWRSGHPLTSLLAGVRMGSRSPRTVRVLLKPTYGTSTRGTAFSIARRVLATTNEKLGTRVAQHCALFHSPAWTNSIRCQREGHKSAPPHNQGGRNFWHLEIRARRIFSRTVFFRDCNFQ